MLVDGMRRGIRRRESEWRRMLAGYEDSGLSVNAFCEGAGISPASFYRWRERFKAGVTSTNLVVRPKASGFIDAGVLEAARPSVTRVDLKLDLGEGWTLHLVRG